MSSHFVASAVKARKRTLFIYSHIKIVFHDVYLHLNARLFNLANNMTYAIPCSDDLNFYRHQVAAADCKHIVKMLLAFYHNS